MELLERNQLIEKYLPWVKKLAQSKKKTYKHTSIDELICAGNKAMVEIACKYEKDKGDFAAFAKKRILGEMTNELRRNSLEGRGLRPILFKSLNTDSLVYYEEESESLFDIVAMVLPNPQKDGQMLRWYFVENLTYKQIGQKVGLTESRVSQIFAFYKRRIKRSFNQADLL